MISYPSPVFKALYWYLSKLDKHDLLITMNYGYSNEPKVLNLAPEDEPNRYPLQLYHHLAEMTDLKGKDVVEIGSGRGGGLAYVAKTFSPSSSKGVDREEQFIKFSNRMFRYDNLIYIKGDALSLPLGDNSCDVILNVESSHRYSSMKTFLSEAGRILRPGGYFLFTDFRYDHAWPDVIENIKNEGFEILMENDITENILQSLQRDSERRITLVKKYAPRVLRKGILNFTGSRGTETYDLFQNRKFIYKSFKLRKSSSN